MSILSVQDVSLAFNGKNILDRLTIEFWEGHVHAVVGPNGAGKSTLAATVMGLHGYRKISGDIVFEGKSILDLPVDERARRGITLAWQEPARFVGLPIREFMRSCAADKSDRAIDDVLEEVGLNPDVYAGRAVDKTLSGGERKKVELASILVMKPKVAMLDEPDSGIDIESISRIFDAVRLLKESGTTVILITHSLTVLQQAEHAFLLCNGRLVDKGDVSKIERYFENKCIPCDHKNLPNFELDATTNEPKDI